MTALLGALTAMTLVGGILLTVHGLTSTTAERVPRRRRRPTLSTRLESISTRARLLIGVGLFGGILAAAYSGVILLALAVPAALAGLPLLLGKPDTRERDMLSALEAWGRSLSAASATGRLTLREVIEVTRDSAPDPIRPAVEVLHHRIQGTWTLAAALRGFAQELDSAWADEVTIYLIQAAEYSSFGLSDALAAISDNLAAQVKLRADIYRERQKPRRVMIQITLIVAAVLTLLVLFARTPQLAPFATPPGQIALAAVLTTLTGLLIWARRIGRPRPEVRFLILDKADMS